MKKTEPIGGEPFYPLSLLNAPAKTDVFQFFKDSFPSKELTYTYGGYYSIKRIIEDIDFAEGDEILLPSYMCPSILIPFKEYNINYSFYKINSKLEVDAEDLIDKIKSNTKAIFFINYFGFPQPSYLLKILSDIKRKGIILIQDLVQAFFAKEEDMIGDYAFNSFRKFFPVEGSVIFSTSKLKEVEFKTNNIYFENKLLGRINRWKYYNGINISEDSFLECFKIANDSYYVDGHIGFSEYDQLVLSKFDFKNEEKIRRENYIYLLSQFNNISIFKNLPDNVVPLCFPILINDKRDIVRKNLINKNVFCPIHWKLSDEIDKKDFFESKKMSNNIISIQLHNIDNDFITIIKQMLYEYQRE